MSGYPRFSDGEMRRRHEALEAVMASREVDQVLAFGANWSGTAVGWLTRWPVTREAVVTVTPGGELPLQREVTSERNTRLDDEAQVATPGNGLPVGDAGAVSLG